LAGKEIGKNSLLPIIFDIPYFCSWLAASKASQGMSGPHKAIFGHRFRHPRCSLLATRVPLFDNQKNHE
jgi:hypothetical protein